MSAVFTWPYVGMKNRFFEISLICGLEYNYMGPLRLDNSLHVNGSRFIKKSKQRKFSYFIIQRMRFSFPNLFSSFLTQKSLSSCVKWTESSRTNTEAVSPESFHSWTRHADCLPASEAIRRRRRLAGESSRISVSDKQAVTAGVSASLFPRRMLSRSLVTKLPPLHDYKNPQMRN